MSTKNLRKQRKGSKGITLIALVITIIVLLILAAVSIATLTGENGILTKANGAKIEVTHATVKESILLKQSDYELETVTGDYKGTLLEFLEKEFIIEKSEQGIYKINVVKLVGEKQPLGNGTNLSDVYQLEKIAETEKYVVNYYDANENKTKIVELSISGKKDENNKKEPEQMEPTELYAKVYEDGTTIFSSSDYVDSSHGKVTDTYSTSELAYGRGEEPPRWLSVSGGGAMQGSDFSNCIIHDKIAPSSTSYWFSMTQSITGLENLITNNVTDMNAMFYVANLVGVDLRNFDTSSVTDMSSMFASCRSLETLDLSSFDTSSVTNMSSMFGSCGSLETLDLSSFDTSSVTNMNFMFDSCGSLKVVDLSSFDTRNVTTMSVMFQSCNSLETLDLSSFDTSSVTNMQSMFAHCNSLKTLNLSSFDTSSVTNMNYMFGYCSSLETLDLSRFDINENTNLKDIFVRCDKLKTVYVKNEEIGNLLKQNTSLDISFVVK